MTTRLPPLLLVLALCAAAPVEGPRGGFSGKSFGDGGGYRHPDQEAGSHLEGPLGPGASLPPGTLPASAPATQPRIEPIPASGNAPSDAAPTASMPAPSPKPRAKTPARRAAPERSASVPEAQTSAATASSPEESAGDDARRDYETRLLGEEEAPRRPELGALAPAPAPAPAPEPALAPSNPELAMAEAGFTAEDRPLFVSLEIDPREAGSLRDAVAGLGMAASFRADPRFEPRPAPNGGISISGWLPSSRLGDAVMRPGVRRVSLENGRPAASRETAGDFLVGVALADPARPDESVRERVADLSARAGFRLSRVVGLETSPDGRVVALLAGRLPLSRLSRAMSRPGVTTVSPATPVEAPAPAPSGPSMKGFASFMAARAQWLLALTALLALFALPSLSGAIKRALSVFIPYR